MSRRGAEQNGQGAFHEERVRAGPRFSAALALSVCKPLAGAALAILLTAAAHAAAGPTVPPERAALPAGRIADLKRYAYGARDGAPQDVTSLAQTPDGYLWIGTQSGIARFDGAHFDTTLQARLPSPSIRSLFVDRQGGLWIGYLFGGVSRLHAGQLTHFSSRELAAGTVTQFLESPDGVLWVATLHGLAKFADGRWTQADAAIGYSGEAPEWMALNDRTMVVSTATAAYALSRGATRFTQIASAEASRMRMSAPPGIRLAPEPLRIEQVFIDHQGAVWVCADGDLLRYQWQTDPAAPPVFERFTGSDGLAGHAYAVLEDREGNVWVGTDRTLQRFSAPKLHRLDALKEAKFPVVAAVGAEIWIGSDQRPVFRAAGDGADLAVLGQSVGTLARAPDGSAWAAGPAGLIRMARGAVTHYPLPVDPGFEKPLLGYQAMAIEPDGALWVSIAGHGLYRRRGMTWDTPSDLPGLPAGPAIRLRLDDAHHLWSTYPSNRVARLEDGHVRLYTEADGLDVGNVLAIGFRESHVWVAGDLGVDALIGDRFVRMTGREGERFAVGSGVVETAAGELWLNAARGIFRIPATSLRRFLEGAPEPVDYELFDGLDGLDSPVMPLRPGPTLVEGADQRLWITRYQGVWWIDPAKMARNTTPPEVLIERLASDGIAYHVDREPALPKLTRALRIDYTATALSFPERVRFRYRLSGVDEGWQDAGTRRQAFYTNLGPGTYRFQVMAINEDGQPSRDVAHLQFRIEPAFYQTWWFRGLCVLVAAFALWRLYLHRLERFMRRLRERQAVRTAERELIARDLHDTLMQGIQGLLFRLQIWEADERIPPSSREEIAAVVVQSRAIVVEGRELLLTMRRGASGGDLAHDLAAVADSEFSGHATQLHVVTDGSRQTLEAVAYDQLLSLGREAVRNAFVHAHANVIEVRIEYGRRALCLSITDDGRGMEAGLLSAGHRAGRFGLVGMRERAAQLHARFAMSVTPRGGTTIRVVVPARVVYARSHAPGGARGRRRL